MSLPNYSKLKTNSYTYLGYKNISYNDQIDALMDEEIKEIETLISFQHREKYFTEKLDFLKQEPYSSFLTDSQSYYFVAYTLGLRVEKRIHYYSQTDLTRMVILDAVANAYLEYLADEFEKTLGDNLTYRFCPGYQGSSVTDLYIMFPLLKPEKIGIELLPSHIMIPQKSMVGIVGVGKKQPKECKNCMLKEKCVYLKEGKKCYL